MRPLVILMIMIALTSAMCVPTKSLGLNFTEGVVLNYDNLVKVYIEKLGTEIVLLKPKSVYQNLLMTKIKELVSKAKKVYTLAHSLYLKGIFDAAMANYLGSLYYIIQAQNMFKYYFSKTLNDYLNVTKAIAEFSISATFSLYKSSCTTPTCVNSTRVVYVYVYELMNKLDIKVNEMIKNLPDSLNSYAAFNAMKMSEMSAKIATLAYAHYVLTMTKGKDSSLTGMAPCPLKGIGKATWLPRACYYFYHPLEPSPCSKFYGIVASYVGLKDLASRLCGVSVG